MSNCIKSCEIYSHTGLRGIAALSVFIYHIYMANITGILNLFAWAENAVDLFFMLSGFIMSWVYVKDHNKINWFSYIIARVARVIPLYFLTTLVLMPIAIYSMLKHGLKYVGDEYPAKIFQNVFLFSGILAGGRDTLNYPAWSVSVEFFCYLFIFPILVCIRKYLVTKRKTLLFATVLCLILIFLLHISYKSQSITILNIGWEPSWLGRGVFGFSLGFVLCGIFRFTLIQNLIPGAKIIDITVLTLISVFLLSRFNLIPKNVFLFVMPFLVLALAYDAGFFASILKLGVLQWLGERSYSIYLWHAPILILIANYYALVFTNMNLNPPYGLFYFFFVIAIVLLISEVSYRCFETPFRKYIRQLGANIRQTTD